MAHSFLVVRWVFHRQVGALSLLEIQMHMKSERIARCTRVDEAQLMQMSVDR